MDEIKKILKSVREEISWISLFMLVIAFCQIVQCINSF